jgi:AraC family transcriptional regulator
MILVELPDVAPRPPTPANAGFRRWFYERWGRENALVVGRARIAEFAPYTQTLSVKRAWGGREDYELGSRRLAVDDTRLLVLNEGAHYGSRIVNPTPVTSLAVFFRPRMAAELSAAAYQTPAALLDESHPAAKPTVGFGEHLRAPIAALEAQLVHLRDAALAGEDDEGWLEERLQGLLWTLGTAEAGWRARSLRLAALSRSAHVELLARVDRAADFMLSELERPLTLDEVAAAAALSKYHLVRVFRAVHGRTPIAFLARERAHRARRLLAQPELTLDEIAARSGLGSRQTLFRQLRRHFGGSGLALRRGSP